MGDDQDEIHVEPASGVMIGGLWVICGMCEGSTWVDFMDLSEEDGKIEMEAAFPECEHCDCIIDATKITFNATVTP